jgi:TPP-dependent pyruvate/acetoin dehydrogenase alpha subunit
MWRSLTRMKRYPAYDPPEYVQWQPDPVLLTEFAEVCRRDPVRGGIIDRLTREDMLDLYAGLLRTRLQDTALKRWVRQGVISKAWLGTGEEATTVGPVHALNRNVDIVAPMIRNAGACCEMGMPVGDTLRSYLGTADAPSKGRDAHVGDFSRRVLQPISNIGNMPAVTAGVALGFKLRGEPGVALTWVGDGSVKHGGTHEAIGFAAAQRLPVIFIVQNNQIALGTEVRVHHPARQFGTLHLAYGVSGWSFDGNNVLDAYAATRIAADRCRNGAGPVILDAETFRMGGHATHDEGEARSMIAREVFERWGARDPIGLYEEHLKSGGVAGEELELIENRIVAEVDHAAEAALQSKQENMPSGATALQDVFANP